MKKMIYILPLLIIAGCDCNCNPGRPEVHASNAWMIQDSTTTVRTRTTDGTEIVFGVTTKAMHIQRLNNYLIATISKMHSNDITKAELELKFKKDLPQRGIAASIAIPKIH